MLSIGDYVVSFEALYLVKNIAAGEPMCRHERRTLDVFCATACSVREILESFSFMSILTMYTGSFIRTTMG